MHATKKKAASTRFTRLCQTPKCASTAILLLIYSLHSFFHYIIQLQCNAHIAKSKIFSCQLVTAAQQFIRDQKNV